MNGCVRIPPTPELFERLCCDFSRLRDVAEAWGDPWPADLDAWADAIAAWSALVE